MKMVIKKSREKKSSSKSLGNKLQDKKSNSPMNKLSQAGERST